MGSIVGANYTTITGDPIAPQQVLFALNLNESFAVNQLLNPALYQSALPSGVPFVYTTGGLFWHDNTTLYLYNDVGERQKSDGIRVFDVLSGTWRSTSVSGGNFQAVFDRGIGGYASIPGRGLSFYTGGAQNATTGLIRFNSANQEELSWTNETASTLYTGRSEGQMAYVPVGADGILLYMGGYNVSCPHTC